MVKRVASEYTADQNERSKRAKYDSAAISFISGNFVDTGDIRKALANPDDSHLTQALTTLRNQLTLLPNDFGLTPQDDRLLLAKSWFEASPGAKDIFSLMDRTPQPSPKVVSLCLAVLSSLLTLFSTHYIYHAYGDSVINSLLSNSLMRKLNSNLASGSSDLILSTLKVFNTMSTYSGGTYQRSVMDGFYWGQKSLHKLLFMRKKGKASHYVDIISKPDIRTLYVFFILSFLSNSTPTSVKLALLEQHREVFLLIFKGISQDPYAVARHILEVCWEGIWNDAKIKRTLKIGLFSEQTIDHVLKLYARDSPEDNTADRIPADLVHHFMLTLTTRPGVGICFMDNGWYPRGYATDGGIIKPTDMDIDDDEFSAPPGSNIKNKILANVVKVLKVNEDARQQELALKILEACPELVAGYWGAVNLTLEPRLSSRWITNISILGTIISFSIPTNSFLLPHSMQRNPSPPPLSSVLGNVLPSVLTKNHLTKGLQSSSRLVRHCTALALSKCLIKFHHVLTAFQEAARHLEENEDTGQWSKRRRELETEVERRVPDSMVIIGLVQQKYLSNEKLLAESALRLLWMYHKMFPKLIAEVRFDSGKLLFSIVGQTSGTSNGYNGMDTRDGPSVHDNQSGMDALRQLHVLRLLKESEKFVWSSKPGPSANSYLHVILTMYARTSNHSVQAATSDLLLHLLSSSTLYSHDPSEIILWINALPFGCRGPQATAPDGTTLSDEITGVLRFLDDCIQRCTKTPYRYLKESDYFFSETSGGNSSPEGAILTPDHPKNAPSPLLMAFLEQLRAKINANILSPSDFLAIVTYIRKLICSMTCKWFDLQPARKLQVRLEEICSLQNVCRNAPMLRDAIKGECEFLSRILCFIETPVIQAHVTSSPDVQQFLEYVENLRTTSSATAGTVLASELIDWIRLTRPALHPTDMKRLMLAVLRFSPSSVKEIFYQLDPQQGHLWHSIEDNVELRPQLPFELAYLHTTPMQMERSYIKEFLVSLFFSATAQSHTFDHKLPIVIHRLAAGMKGNKMSTITPEISLLTSILAASHSQCTKVEIDILKRLIFVEFKAIRELCCSANNSNAVSKEIFALVKVGLDPELESDKMFARDYCTYWTTYLKKFSSIESCTLASPWFKFMDYTDIIQYLDVVISAVQDGHQFSNDSHVVSCILDTLAQSQIKPALSRDLQRRWRGLLDLRSRHDESSLDMFLLLIVESCLPIGCNGFPPSAVSTLKVSDLTLAAQERWKARTSRLLLNSDCIEEFLEFEGWTETNARMVSGILYQSLPARHKFSTWLAQKEPYSDSALGIIAIALYALLDVTYLQDAGPTSQLPDQWVLSLGRHLIHGQDSPKALALCASCIRKVMEFSFSKRACYADHLLNELRNARGSRTSISIFSLVHDLYQLDAMAFSTLLEECSDQALEWMVDRFSKGVHSDDDSPFIETMVAVISCRGAKAHLVEPVLKATIQTCFNVPNTIKGITSIVACTSLKPVTVNRVLQSIVQHPELYHLTESSLSTREPIIKLLHVLFYLHPTNTCQPSHVIPLAPLYGGTLSFSDQLLISIFLLYEKQRKEPVASIFHHLCLSAPRTPSKDVLSVIMSLDPTRVFRTCTGFQTRRRLDVSIIVESDYVGGDGEYDHVFLTLLVVQLLAERKQLSTPEWVQVFHSNIVSVVMCTLTSRDESLREVGVTTLAGILQRIQDSDFLEKAQVTYMMDMLQDLLPPASTTSSTPPPRLPTLPILFLAHALRSVFYPASPVYPIISRFLLQRPEFDVKDVPMLYSLLYSSSDGGEWVQERAWMIRLLADSMREGGAREWAIFKRRHTWDLIASMWQATRKDERLLRRGILELLANLSVNRHAITSLILRSALLSWIELQLRARHTQEAEDIALVKILENILSMVDMERIDRAMRGECSATVARCLCMVLRDIRLSENISSLVLLTLASRIILCMVLRASPNVTEVAETLRLAIDALKRTEPSIVWVNTTLRHTSFRSPQLSMPPHYARGLLDLSSIGDSLVAWIQCVRFLWRATMSLGERLETQEYWDVLSCRMLLIGAFEMHDTEKDGDGDVEWVRRQTIALLL